MLVQLLYFDGCPNWTVADERLVEAISAVNDSSHIGVERHRVETVEEAQKVGFTGSPTILVNGTDPFATGAEQVGLACRLYTTSDGPGGSPTVAQLIKVLS